MDWMYQGGLAAKEDAAKKAEVRGVEFPWIGIGSAHYPFVILQLGLGLYSGPLAGEGRLAGRFDSSARCQQGESLAILSWQVQTVSWGFTLCIEICVLLPSYFAIYLSSIPCPPRLDHCSVRRPATSLLL